MNVPRAYRQPIPQSAPRWLREVKGICRLIERIDVLKRDEGDDWVARMRAYYIERLDALLGCPPGRHYDLVRELRAKYTECERCHPYLRNLLD